VEFLLGSVVTVIIALTATSMLLANESSRRMLQMQTDRYESVRQAADVMLQDARFASQVSCNLDWLRLNLVAGPGSGYIVYQFQDAAGNPDPDNLHRLVYDGGGVVQRDDIVGWGLVPIDWWGGESTNFACNNSLSSRKATVQLVKVGHKTSAPNIILEFTIFLRT